VDLGYTMLSKDEVRSILKDMCAEYPGADFDLLSKNCCSFSADLVTRLDLPPIPSWVLNLANTGTKAADMVGGERLCALGNKTVVAVEKVVEAFVLGILYVTATLTTISLGRRSQGKYKKNKAHQTSCLTPPSFGRWRLVLLLFYSAFLHMGNSGLLESRTRSRLAGTKTLGCVLPDRQAFRVASRSMASNR